MKNLKAILRNSSVVYHTGTLIHACAPAFPIFAAFPASSVPTTRQNAVFPLASASTQLILPYGFYAVMELVVTFAHGPIASERERCSTIVRAFPASSTQPVAHGFGVPSVRMFCKSREQRGRCLGMIAIWRGVTRFRSVEVVLSGRKCIIISYTNTMSFWNTIIKEVMQRLVFT